VSGVLEDPNLQVSAEKRIADLSQKGATNSFLVNTVGPMLVAKHFSPLLYAKVGLLAPALQTLLCKIVVEFVLQITRDIRPLAMYRSLHWF
jgi:hypothetical protein